MAERTAIICVDVQGTFADDFEGAGLPVPGAAKTVKPMRDFVLRAAKSQNVVAVVTSQDWHPEHLPEHMIEPDGTPDFANKLFTRHGIAGTPEAELHPDFDTPEIRAVITDWVKKGQRSAAFSAFEGVDDEGRSLADILHDKEVDRLVVIGWELANCVSATAIDGAKEGFKTTVVVELTSVLDPSGPALANTLGNLQGWEVETVLTAQEAEDRYLGGVPATAGGCFDYESVAVGAPEVHDAYRAIAAPIVGTSGPPAEPSRVECGSTTTVSGEPCRNLVAPGATHCRAQHSTRVAHRPT